MTDLPDRPPTPEADPSRAERRRPRVPPPPERRGGGTFGLTVVDIAQEAGEVACPPLPAVAFVANVDTPDTIAFDDGGGWIDIASHRGWVNVQPSGQPHGYRVDRAAHLRAVNVGERELSRCLEDRSLSASDLSGAVNRFRHLPSAAAWIHRICQASEATRPVGMPGIGAGASNLEVDAAFLSLVAEILRACGDERVLAPPPRVGDRRIGRVIDYVEAYLDRPLTVGELAGIAHVSVFHFGRVFKRETGEPPHRYVMRRRVERAKDRLLTTDWDLTSVALACGFASHSHLSDSFRRFEGCTPSAWRDAKRH